MSTDQGEEKCYRVKEAFLKFMAENFWLRNNEIITGEGIPKVLWSDVWQEWSRRREIALMKTITETLIWLSDINEVECSGWYITWSNWHRDSMQIGRSSKNTTDMEGRKRMHKIWNWNYREIDWSCQNLRYDKVLDIKEPLKWMTRLSLQCTKLGHMT